jgi:hypothetical protein
VDDVTDVHELPHDGVHLGFRQRQAVALVPHEPVEG